MADDLGDNWWETGQNESEKTLKGKKGTVKKDTNKKTPVKTIQSNADEPVQNGSQKKVLKRKRARTENEMENTTRKKKKLSEVENSASKKKPPGLQFSRKDESTPNKTKTDRRKKVKKAKTSSTKEGDGMSPKQGKKQNSEGGGGKKQRDKKRISEVSEEELSRPGTGDDLRSVLTAQLKGRLGEEALNDLLPNTDTDFFPPNTDSLEASEYLRSVLPGWRVVLKKSLFMKKAGSPSLLVVTSSAIRAVELSRDLKDFVTDKCKVAKLFAKHMKIEDQKKFLSKTNCQVGIGTPSRISQLVKQGALQLESLVGVVLDWNWRDQKLKRMSDIPEVRADLVALVKDFVMETVQGSECKLALL